MMTDLTGKDDLALHTAFHKRGDEAAFAELTRRHGPPLMKFLRGMLGADCADADDIYQEAWLRVINNGSKWHGGSFKAWLATIARNLAIDSIRRRKPALSLDEENGEGARLHDAIRDTRPDAAAALSGAELGREISAAVGALPEGQREVFLMRTAEGLSFKEIAEALGVSINTALGRMHYAVGKLKKTLAHLDESRFAPRPPADGARQMEGATP